jgi:hypothetical protein
VRALRVLAEERAPKDVDVPVFLALHGIGTQVGDEPEALWAVSKPHLHSDLAHVPRRARAPPGSRASAGRRGASPAPSAVGCERPPPLRPRRGCRRAPDGRRSDRTCSSGSQAGVQAWRPRPPHDSESRSLLRECSRPRLRCFDKLSMPLCIALATSGVLPHPEPVEGPPRILVPCGASGNRHGRF